MSIIIIIVVNMVSIMAKVIVLSVAPLVSIVEWMAMLMVCHLSNAAQLVKNISIIAVVAL
jgi:hypothetical protein